MKRQIVCDAFKIEFHLRNSIQAVVCINLKRREERWKAFQERLPGDWPFRKIVRFPAIDGRACVPPPWWKESAGAWGCYRSHLRVVEDCLNNDLESVLVLEDDAEFPPTFAADAAEFLRHVPDDWDMLYLGGQLLK